MDGSPAGAARELPAAGSGVCGGPADGSGGVAPRADTPFHSAVNRVGSATHSFGRKRKRAATLVRVAALGFWGVVQLDNCAGVSAFWSEAPALAFFADSGEKRRGNQLVVSFETVVCTHDGTGLVVVRDRE